MASQVNHGYPALASRLIAAADGIVNSAASGLERDLREAGGILLGAESPAPLSIARLVSDLRRIANETNDPITKEQLTRLLGGA